LFVDRVIAGHAIPRPFSRVEREKVAEGRMRVLKFNLASPRQRAEARSATPQRDLERYPIPKFTSERAEARCSTTHRGFALCAVCENPTPPMTFTATSSIPVERTYLPEVSPFSTVIVDITHRCNMACANCYVPNREIPDLDASWVLSVLGRLPRGTFVRLVGGEPTLRNDLPELIRAIRALGLHPVVVSNGLRFADRNYVRTLKASGLQIAYLSFNGGFDDDLYETLDDMRCAAKKIAAFENLKAEHLYTSIGMIVVRGVNEREVTPVLEAVLRSRNVREFHLRSVGAMGRHMKTDPLTLPELRSLFAHSAGVAEDSLDPHVRTGSSYDFAFRRLRVQLTTWPDLGSTTRGRLTPEGLIAPFMEHVIANDGGY
jgi:pyruvate-formate lyase-activating enzyme